MGDRRRGGGECRWSVSRELTTRSCGDLVSDGEAVDEIYTDLTGRRGASGINLTEARRLPENAGVAFMGDTKGGPFDVPGDQAREWLRVAGEPERPAKRRRPKALGKRHGPHPPAGAASGL